MTRILLHYGLSYHGSLRNCSVRHAMPTVVLSLAMLAILLPGCNKEEATIDLGDGAGPTATGTSDGTPPLDTAVPDVVAAIPASTETPQQIMQAMADAYKAATSYGDHAGLRLMEQRLDGQPPGDVMQPLSYTIAFERPNRVRMEIDQGLVLLDGENLIAQSAFFPNQMIRLPIPADITPRTLMGDVAIFESISVQGLTAPVSWVPIQLLLLLNDSPLDTLIPEDAQLSLLDPQQFKLGLVSHTCDRVAVDSPLGRTVYWIDRADHALRRVELPTGPLGVSPEQAASLSLFIDISDATLNIPPSPQAFEASGPSNIRFVEQFQPTGFQLLGKKPPAFEWTGTRGEKMTADSLDGKTTVLIFWTSDPQNPQDMLASHETLAAAALVRERYLNDPSIAFVSVNINSPKQVTDETLNNLMRDWSVSLPVYRDPDGRSFVESFEGVALPTVILTNPQGQVEAYSVGQQSGLADSLSDMIEAIVSGTQLSKLSREQYQQRQASYDESLDRAEKSNIYRAQANVPDEADGAAADGAAAADTQDDQPEGPQFPPRKDPATMNVVQAFERANQVDLTQSLPSEFMLAVDGPDVDAMIIAPGEKKVTLTLLKDGQPTATGELAIEAMVTVSMQTAVDGDGNRFYALLIPPNNGVYLLDSDLKLIRKHQRESTPAQPVLPIQLADLADLDGDGQVELILGDAQGVENVSMLDGTRNWFRPLTQNRPLQQQGFDTVAIGDDAAAGETGNAGQRQLLCAASPEGQSGMIYVIDASGNPVRQFKGSKYGWRVSQKNSVSGDAAITILQHMPDRWLLIGLDLQGELVWRLPIPGDSDVVPLHIGTVQLPGDDRTAWTLLTSDGTVRFIGPDGQLVDEFVLGTLVGSLNTGHWQGDPALMLTTPIDGKMSVWQLQPKSTPVVTPPAATTPAAPATLAPPAVTQPAVAPPVVTPPAAPAITPPPAAIPLAPPAE